jgi:pyruvate dehydrogenase kinase 2/3/4
MHRELAIRLAHRVVELQSLPYGLSEMRSVRRVKELYENSFADIVMYPRPEKAGEEERRFTELLRHIRDRHADVVRQVACGVLELKQSCGMGADDIHISSFLDRFYTSRIGIRVLISQQVSMSLERARQGYVGIIHIRCRPAHVAADAADAARALAYRHYGEEPPEVIILGKTDLEFPYIEGHLYHVLFELLKNSIRATMEHHLGQDVFPPIKVIIADGQEDVTLKIADEGGGIPRSSLPKIWTYMFTTATIPPEALIQEEYHPGGGSEHPRAVGMDPLAGFGYGLPLSRLYARYFGGELSVASMEGFGTDAYVHLAKLGNRLEAVV